MRQLTDAGVGYLRVELTDQPGELVGPMLERYAALARRRGEGEGEEAEAEAEAEAVFEWLNANLIDSTGHRPGVTTGSFRPSTERKWASLRPTAAEERAKEKVAGKASKTKRR